MNSARGMAVPGPAELAGVEETMAEVRRNWSVMLQEDFNPIPVALDLLAAGSGGSGLGQDADAFARLYARLDASMNVVVERYYTGFNDAVSIFSGIVEGMGVSRDDVAGVRKDVVDFRDHVQYRRPELPDQWAALQTRRAALAAARKTAGVAEQQQRSRDLATRLFFVPAARTLMDAMHDARYLRGTAPREAQDVLVDACKALDSDRDALFDALLDEAQRVLFLREDAHARQLHAAVLQRCPDAPDVPGVGADDAGDTQAGDDAGLEDADLVLAPAEFEFSPDVSAAPYLRSLVRAASTLELLPAFLQILAQRAPGSLHEQGEASLARAADAYAEARAALQSSGAEAGHGYASGEGDPGDAGNSVILGWDVLGQKRGAETRALLPVLEDACDHLFGHVLATAAGMRIVADAAIAAGGSQAEASVTAYVNACRSAIAGESRAFLAAVLRGGDAADGAAADAEADAAALVFALKAGLRGSEGKQRHRAALYVYSEVEVLPGALQTTQPAQDAAYEAGARKLASLLVVDPFVPSPGAASHTSPAAPTLHALPYVCPAHSAFCGRLDAVLGPGEPGVDVRYVSGLLDESYAPQVASEAAADLASSFDAPDSLQPVALGAVRMATCVLRGLALCAHILRLAHVLPAGASGLEPAAAGVLAAVVERSDAKVRDVLGGAALMSLRLARDARMADVLVRLAALWGVDAACIGGTIADGPSGADRQFSAIDGPSGNGIGAVNGTTPGDPTHNELAGKWTGNVTVSQASADGAPVVQTGDAAARSRLSMGARTSPTLRAVQDVSSPETTSTSSVPDVDADAAALLLAKERLLFEQLRGDRSIHASEAVFDERAVRAILLLSRSLAAAGPALEGRLGRAAVYLRHDGSRLRCVLRDGRSASESAMSPAFELQYARFCDSAAGLARTLLHAVRLELRVHACYFLDLAFREGDYSAGASSAPDAYVAALSSDALRLDSLLADALPPAHCAFVLAGYADDLDNALVSGIRGLRGLAPEGVPRLLATLAAMEHVLGRMGAAARAGRPAARLGRARALYGLAAAGPAGIADAALGDGRVAPADARALLEAFLRGGTDSSVIEPQLSRLASA